MDKPKKWTEVYPNGTKEGDEEAKFFKALARHPKYDWRSTGAIVKASGLPQDRVEEIIDKYVNMTPPLVFPHPKNDAHWGYWERVPDMLKDDNRDLSTKDKDNRIGKHLGTDIMFLADEDDIYIDEDVMADKIDLGLFQKHLTEPMSFPKDDELSLHQFSSGDANLDPGPYDAPEVSVEDLKLQILAENYVGLMIPAPEIPMLQLSVAIPEPNVQLPPIVMTCMAPSQEEWTLDV